MESDTPLTQAAAASIALRIAEMLRQGATAPLDVTRISTATLLLISSDERLQEVVSTRTPSASGDPSGEKP